MGKNNLIFERQFLHLLGLGILLYLLSLAGKLPGFMEGEALGISTKVWLYVALVNSIAHQLYVWFCWRTQLHTNLLTRYFGKKAFRNYAAGFTVLIILRPLLITILAVANRDTVQANPYYMKIAAPLLLIPAAYLGYSIVRYFSFPRAFGIDHFDESYRSIPLVREGIFRFTPNAMYTFGFFLLWAPALFFSSISALTFALFSHLYIWVHYFCTEKPDMVRIYGRNDSNK
jgi:uncharacterized integral membrane protein